MAVAKAAIKSGQDRKKNESDLVYNTTWENSGVNFTFSAWEHLDNSIIYVYSNFGSREEPFDG